MVGDYAVSDDPLARGLAAAEVFADTRIPEHLREEIVITCKHRGNSITLAESRPPWNLDLIGPDWTEVKVAQLRFDKTSDGWALYCRDRNERWWQYEGIGPATSVDPLLAEIDADPTEVFWG